MLFTFTPPAASARSLPVYHTPKKNLSILKRSLIFKSIAYAGTIAS
ncbi:hypothetical protein [Microcoleus sp. D2_18a_B4]